MRKDMYMTKTDSQCALHNVRDFILLLVGGNGWCCGLRTDRTTHHRGKKGGGSRIFKETVYY
jgi:hypothetical protein